MEQKSLHEEERLILMPRMYADIKNHNDLHYAVRNGIMSIQLHLSRLRITRDKTTLQKQIDELRSQLQQSTEKQISLPKSEEELAEWAKTYPDVAKIVETIAIKKAKEQTQALDERFKQLDEREHKTSKDKAEAELMRLTNSLSCL